MSRTGWLVQQAAREQLILWKRNCIPDISLRERIAEKGGTPNREKSAPTVRLAEHFGAQLEVNSFPQLFQGR